MTTVSINGHELNTAQIECLREALLIQIVSNTETLRRPDGGDMTVFYHYRRCSFVLLQVLDNDPLSAAPNQYAVQRNIHAKRRPGDEPTVVINGFCLDVRFSMTLRIALTGIGFCDKQVAQSKTNGVPMDELVALQRMLFSE